MLKIASVCRTLPTPEQPGAGIFVLRRMAAMAERAQVSILQPVPYFPGVRPLPAWSSGGMRQVGAQQVETRPMLYVPGLLKSFDSDWLARAVLPVMRKKKAHGALDAIDAHFGFPDGAGCVAVAQRLSVPVFVTIRGLEADRVARPVVGARMIRALNAATGIISVSHALLAILAGHGLDTRHATIIPNGIDRQLFSPGDRQAARAELGLSMQDRWCITVADLKRGKRHDDLIRAVRAVPGLKLALAGSPKNEPETAASLARLTRELGISERVRFLGGLPNEKVARWLQAADVFALATIAEGCCNAVLEALATGLPVITTPVGDNPNYVLPERNGVLVPVNDSVAMAAAISNVLSRPWDAQAIARELPVGDWSSVGARVIDWMTDRIGR